MGGWDDEGRGGRRVMLIPVNEGNGQAPLAKAYRSNTNKYNLKWNFPLLILAFATHALTIRNSDTTLSFSRVALLFFPL